MKDVVVDEIKRDSLGKFIAERIKENKELFTNEELTIIKKNYILTKKLYMLGMINTQKIKVDKSIF